ncbi:hypothetical protein NDN08_002085 [Rhodosorus marinus]|uniref:C2H2-type domain-containing protein n=1 Tax=Rhodosorus marinus TaxID=101924 RepID=A0AAV8UVK1_9RHOD|nr:hypothetical protein NDN08_002085 [Rhodosorus marinus]
MEFGSVWMEEESDVVAWMTETMRAAKAKAAMAQLMNQHSSPRESMGMPMGLPLPTIEKKRPVKRKRTYTTASCPICEKVFFRKYEMMRHVRATHLGMRPFHCDRCSSSFSRKAHLQLHLLKIHHVDDQPIPNRVPEVPETQSRMETLPDLPPLQPVEEDVSSQFALYGGNFSWV